MRGEEMSSIYSQNSTLSLPLSLPQHSMDSTKEEVAYEIQGFIKVYKDGHVERLRDTDFVPPSSNLFAGISSKDITIIPQPNISARLYLPKIHHPNQKFPLLVYFHGGGFCVSSPFCNKYHSYLTKLVAEANVVAVSVNYRKAPEHPIPAAYVDSWAALQWVVSHRNNNGPEPWLNENADFGRVFLAGESAGANIAHNLAITAGSGDSDSGLGIGLLGIALVHPYFWGLDPIGSEILDPDRKASIDKLWPFICPSNPDNDDPRINPVAVGGPSLIGLGCKRVLVSVAEKDLLRDRGWLYYQALSNSGWMGVAEIDETDGEGHTFHLLDLEYDKAKDLIQPLADFFNRDMPFLL